MMANTVDLESLNKEICLQFVNKSTDEIKIVDPYKKALELAEKEYDKKCTLVHCIPLEPVCSEWAPITLEDIEFQKSSNKILKSLDNLYAKI